MEETATSRRWRRVVEDHNASGLTMAAYATSRNIKAGTLNWWRCRLRKFDREAASNREPQFTALTVTTTASTVVLVLDEHSAHVVVDHDTDLALLRRVVEAMA